MWPSTSGTIKLLNTDELEGDWDTLVETGSELVDALATASAGEITQIASKSITTSDWLDLDVDDVVVRGVDGQTTITVADGANVGGFRIGSNSATEDALIKQIHFNGNAENQDQSVERLHAFICEDTDKCEFINCSGTRTSPHHDYVGDNTHNSGGSVFTCRSNAVDTVYRDCESVDTGDRAWQLAGEGHKLIRPKTRDGFDRSCSLDVQLPDGTWDGADDVTIINPDFKNNTDGSFVATREYGSVNITIRGGQMRGTFRGAVQGDNADCDDWTAEATTIDHTGTDNSQIGIYLPSNSKLDGVDMVEDAATGWATPIEIHGANSVIDALSYRLRNTDNTDAVINVRGGADGLEIDGGRIKFGSHNTGVNIIGGIDVTITDLTVDEFGDGDGAGAAVRINNRFAKVSDCTGVTANTPRAFIAWDDPSGVCTDNYDRSGATTHYDFAQSPDLTADNYPVPA